MAGVCCTGAPGGGAQIRSHAWLGQETYAALAGYEVLSRFGSDPTNLERVVSSVSGLGAGIGLVFLAVSLADLAADDRAELQQHQRQHTPNAVANGGVQAAVGAYRGARWDVLPEPLPDVVSRRIVRKNSRLSIHDAYTFPDGPPLGAGAFGVVYRAVDAATGVERAVKRVERSAGGSATRRLGEVEALLRTDHPNICRIVEYFEAGRYLWLVMELCQGEELCNLILKSPTGLPEQRAGNLLAQMLRAALHCHRHAGIVHRDLKPENFLLQGDALKLIDFGFAAAAGPQPGTSGYERRNSGQRNGSGTWRPDGPPSAGTMLYMSPQMLRGQAPARSDDVWSLGVVFYILLTGRFPFSTNDDDEFQEMVDHGQLEQDVTYHLDRLRASPLAVDLAKKLLAFHPADRISAEEALQHPFLAEAWFVDAPHLLRPEEIHERCVSFKQASLLRRIAAAAAARFVAQDDCSIQPLRETFLALDTEGDGRLAAEDLQSFLQSACWAAAASDAQGLSSASAPARLPENTSAAALKGLAGRRGIGYSAFVAAMLDDGALLDNDHMARAIFDVLDADQDGLVTAGDLHRRLGLRLEDAERAITEALGVVGAWAPRNSVAAALGFSRPQRHGGVDFPDFLRVLRQRDSIW